MAIEPPPTSPYRVRIHWPEVKMLVTPAHPALANELREELKRLREMVTAGETPQDVALIATTVTALTTARDDIRRWAQPIYGVLLAVAAAFTSTSALFRYFAAPFTWWAVGVGLCTGLLAAWAAVYMVKPWLDLLPEYDGLMADLRRVAEKAGSTAPHIGAIPGRTVRIELGTLHRDVDPKMLAEVLEEMVPKLPEGVRIDLRPGPSDTEPVEEPAPPAEAKRGEKP